MMRRLVGPACLLLVVGALAPVLVEAQEATVRGTVTNARTGEPLSGVQVYFPGLNTGTLSNANGEYTVEGVPTGEHELRAEIIGRRMESQIVTVPAEGSVTVTFSLETSAIGLDEIVVTGTPGAQLRRSLGNVVGRVEAAELQDRAPVRDLQSLLQGADPGLNVDVGGNSRLGTGANIRIRGVGSMALSSQPLLYIDGVRVNNEFSDRHYLTPGMRAVSHNTAPSRWQDINPEEIESIEVIKGPAASTLYGTEASNGVINVITKRGSVGAPQFSARVGLGANWLSDPESAFNPTYFRCAGTSGTCTPGEIVEFNVLREDRVRHGLNHFQRGLPRSFGASVEGGVDELRFRGSADWDRDEGILRADWQTRLNTRANLTWTPSDKLTVQAGMGSLRSELRDAIDSSLLGLQWACAVPGCEAGSGLPRAVDGYFRGYFVYMPDKWEEFNFSFQNVNRTNFNVTATHRPTPWLTHRFTTGADWTEVINSQLQLRNPGGINYQAGRKLRETSDTEYVSLDYSATATVNVSPELSLATSAGVQYNRKQFHDTGASGSRFSVTGLETISSGTELFASENFVENKTLGAYVQEQLSWRNRLFLTVAARGDDNSAFGENFEFVVYPKVSASWVLSEEPFMEGLVGNRLNQLRLRGAWGKAGQQPDFFAAIRTYRPVRGPGGAGALTRENIGNPDLKPEVGEEVELGFDASLWNDRLSVELTYYNQVRNDAIFKVPTRPSLGFPGVQFRNLGEIKNSGFELGLEGSVLDREDLGVDLSLSLSTNSNEISSMGGLQAQILRASTGVSRWTYQFFAEGFPLGAMFMKRVVSAEVQGSGPEARAVNVMCEGGDVLPIGNPAFPLSRGGGPVVPCAQAPYLYFGAPIPTREISARTTVRLGDNLSFYAQADYMGGHRVVDNGMVGRNFQYRNSRAALERSDPIFLGYESLSGRDGWHQPSTFDASFVRLRRVSATFDFPRSWIANVIGADRMSLTLSGINLWLIWQATPEMLGDRVLDPEARFTNPRGEDPGGLASGMQDQGPAMNRIMATLRVTF